MRRILFSLIALLAMTQARATTQEGELIMWQGKLHNMVSLPLNREMDSTLTEKYHVKWNSTALWRGWQGYWSIRDGVLCLDSVIVYDQDKMANGMKVTVEEEPVFAPYLRNGVVEARWVSMVLRITTGHIIRGAGESGFRADFEHEDMVRVLNGEVKEVKSYDNTLVNCKSNHWVSLENQYKVFAKETTNYLQYLLPNVKEQIRLRLTHTSYDPERIKCTLASESAKRLGRRDRRKVLRKLPEFVVKHSLMPYYYIRGKYSSIPLTVHNS